MYIPSLKLTANGPENQWLEDDSFPLGAILVYSQVPLLSVSGRGKSCIPFIFVPNVMNISAIESDPKSPSTEDSRVVAGGLQCLVGGTSL